MTSPVIGPHCDSSETWSAEEMQIISCGRMPRVNTGSEVMV